MTTTKKTQKVAGATKGSKTSKSDPKPPKTPAVARAPKEPREDLVVFAIRLTRAERDLIHEVTGPAKASKFVRGLAIAAASGDEKAVREIMDGLKLPPAA